ncbi:MAG: universal stress protein [Actinobacteria bacterium]|nr:universal stress protein [Actinomycetota bacterium]
MKVLIATDGSELALHAVSRGVELLGSVESVTVLAVLTDSPGDDAGGIEGSTESPAEAAAELVSEEGAAAAAIDAAIDALPEPLRARAMRRVEAGDAGPMIAWVAAHEGTDVIVMGSHGRGAFKRALMGSVSEHLVRHAPCPVLVIRSGV